MQKILFLDSWEHYPRETRRKAAEIAAKLPARCPPQNVLKAVVALKLVLDYYMVDYAALTEKRRTERVVEARKVAAWAMRWYLSDTCVTQMLQRRPKGMALLDSAGREAAQAEWLRAQLGRGYPDLGNVLDAVLRALAGVREPDAVVHLRNVAPDRREVLRLARVYEERLYPRGDRRVPDSYRREAGLPYAMLPPINQQRGGQQTAAERVLLYAYWAWVMRDQIGSVDERLRRGTVAVVQRRVLRREYDWGADMEKAFMPFRDGVPDCVRFCSWVQGQRRERRVGVSVLFWEGVREELDEWAMPGALRVSAEGLRPVGEESRFILAESLGSAELCVAMPKLRLGEQMC